MTTIPRIRFLGDSYAQIMNAVFAETLADLLAKLENGAGDFPKGFFHTSTLPHSGTCYYDQIWARDAGRGAQELARLGFTEEAMAAVDFFLAHKNFGDHWGRLIDRPMREDFELDGNTHILNAIAQTWQAAGQSKPLGRRYLEGCLPVFQWMEQCMNACPIGDLIPCCSELAGNPCNAAPVYAIYPNYGAAVTMGRFAQLADVCDEPRQAKFLQTLAHRLIHSLHARLVSNGERTCTRVPKGVWLNGLTEAGAPYEQADYEATFSLHCWTRQLPFIQQYDAGFTKLLDDDLKAVHEASYAYLRSAMAKHPYFRQYGFVSNTAWHGMGGRHDDTMFGYGQNYFTQAALLMEDVNTYGKCLEGIARLSYDGNVIEPMTFDMNPFIPHECFDYNRYERGEDHSFGTFPHAARHIADNPGDEGNLVQACETLKTLSMVAGISIENDVLTVAPRLPWLWDGLELTDWPVWDHRGIMHRISLHYEHKRWERSCGVTVTQPDGLTHMQVRFGPFPAVTNTRQSLNHCRREEAPGAAFYWQTGGLIQSFSL